MLFLVAFTGGCATRSDVLLPIPATVRGANHVRDIEVVITDMAAPAVGALDERAAKSGAEPVALAVDPADYRTLPFGRMMELTIRDATAKAGLTAGRALKLLVEIDSLQVAGAGEALFGRDDRLQGSVFVRDAATGQALGQLYIDIDRVNGGLLNALTRGGGVRESLAQEFARRVADALAAPRGTTKAPG